MIEVRYPQGQVRQFDALSAPDRRTLACSLMTPVEMARFFNVGEAAAMAKQLGLDPKGAEAVVCTRIHAHFNR